MTKEEFLSAIAKIESNNGRNINHPMVNTGINKGTHAIGTYALMPATVDELIKKRSEYSDLGTMTPDQKQQYLLAHPEAQQALAGQMYEHLSNRYNADPQKMAYAYNHGMYLPNSRMTPEKLAADNYTNKFNKLTGKLASNTTEQAKIMPEVEENLKKSSKNLPTIDVASLESILNDPRNPFNQTDEEDSYF